MDQTAQTTTGERLEWSVFAALAAELAAYRARRPATVVDEESEQAEEAA